MTFKEKVLAMVKSRRFLTAVAGVVAVAGHDLFGVSEEQSMMIAGVVIAWIVGDSLRATR